MVEFAVERVEPIFSGHVFGVERRHLLADGEPFDREVVTHPGAVAILALEADGSVILLEQFRATVDARILEIPAGTLDVAGEDPVDAARRELLEEAGVDARTMTALGRFRNSPGYSTQATTIFLAEDLTEVGRTPVGVEESEMAVIRVPLSEALEMVDDGRIVDAQTVLGLLLCARRRRA